MFVLYPSIFLLLSVVATIYGEDSYLMWIDYVITDILLVCFWFVISFVISLIVYIITGNKSKNVNQEIYSMNSSDDKIIIQKKKDEIVFEMKSEINVEREKNSKINTNTLYFCESIVDTYREVVDANLPNSGWIEVRN